MTMEGKNFFKSDGIVCYQEGKNNFFHFSISASISAGPE